MQNSIGIIPAISYFFDKSEFTSSRFLFLAADFCSVLIGADEVIFPERIAGIRYANSIISDNITDYFNISDGYGIVQILITDKFKPQTLIELDSRNKYDVNIISIKRNKKVFIPKGSDTINPGDEVLVIGKDAKVAKFNSSINGK